MKNEILRKRSGERMNSVRILEGKKGIKDNLRMTSEHYYRRPVDQKKSTSPPRAVNPKQESPKKEIKKKSKEAEGEVVAEEGYIFLEDTSEPKSLQDGKVQKKSKPSSSPKGVEIAQDKEAEEPEEHYILLTGEQETSEVTSLRRQSTKGSSSAQEEIFEDVEDAEVGELVIVPGKKKIPQKADAFFQKPQKLMKAKEEAEVDRWIQKAAHNKVLPEPADGGSSSDVVFSNSQFEDVSSEKDGAVMIEDEQKKEELEKLRARTTRTEDQSPVSEPKITGDKKKRMSTSFQVIICLTCFFAGMLVGGGIVGAVLATQF